MDVQAFVVALAVAASVAYAAVTLAPRALRRRVAAWLLRVPLLAGNATLTRAAAGGGSACGCDGCDAGAAGAPKAPASQVIRFSRKPPA
ncbi:MAG: hypothetical protein JSR18_06590 [Proteobacteria bacterium]|nr:hypothetical protein [Pseudomonadota bacterium]